MLQELRYRVFSKALELLPLVEDVEPYTLLERAIVESGVSTRILLFDWLTTPYERVGWLFDVGEQVLFHLSYTGTDRDDVFAGCFITKGGIDKWEELCYLGFIDSVSYSKGYPDKRERLHILMTKLLYKKDLHLRPIALPPMDRFSLAKQVLTSAFADGSLQPGRYTHCPLHFLITEGLGYEDLSWINSFESMIYGLPLNQDVPSFNFYASASGYTVDELLAIEGAFEGQVLSNERRVSMSRDETVFDRYLRVQEALLELELQTA